MDRRLCWDEVGLRLRMEWIGGCVWVRLEGG